MSRWTEVRARAVASLLCPGISVISLFPHSVKSYLKGVLVLCTYMMTYMHMHMLHTCAGEAEAELA